MVEHDERGADGHTIGGLGIHGGHATLSAFNVSAK
jgi:hypothetical protein